MCEIEHDTLEKDTLFSLLNNWKLDQRNRNQIDHVHGFGPPLPKSCGIKEINQIENILSGLITPPGWSVSDILTLRDKYNEIRPRTFSHVVDLENFQVSYISRNPDIPITNQSDEVQVHGIDIDLMEFTFRFLEFAHAYFTSSFNIEHSQISLYNLNQLKVEFIHTSSFVYGFSRENGPITLNSKLWQREKYHQDDSVFEMIKAAITHELMHAFQYSFHLSSSKASDYWILEGVASWSEIEISSGTYIPLKEYEINNSLNLAANQPSTITWWYYLRTKYPTSQIIELLHKRFEVYNYNGVHALAEILGEIESKNGYTVLNENMIQYSMSLRYVEFNTTVNMKYFAKHLPSRSFSKFPELTIQKSNIININNPVHGQRGSCSGIKMDNCKIQFCLITLNPPQTTDETKIRISLECDDEASISTSIIGEAIDENFFSDQYLIPRRKYVDHDLVNFPLQVELGGDQGFDQVAVILIGRAGCQPFECTLNAEVVTE